MSTETLPNTTELGAERARLPQGEALRDLYNHEFGTMELPDSYEMTEDFSSADVVFYTSNPDNPQFDIDRLHKEFIAQAVDRAYEDSWWVGMAEKLKVRGADPAAVDNLSFVAKHALDIVVKGNQTGQGFEVFELGEHEKDNKVLEAVFDTLQAVDQFSGGLMAADPERPKIVLSNGLSLQNPHGGELGGIATERVVLVNMPALRKMAEESGSDLYDLVSVVVTHEVLGHGTERAVEGDTGRYFYRHFDYSREREKGKIFEAVHAAVEPKDASMAGSQPVREYGRVNGSEDLATSVDSTVAEAMGWAPGVENLPRFKSTPDRYRSDLAVGLMQRAAKLALKHAHTPGIVGSELHYSTGPNGEVTGVEPARKIEVSSISGEQAMQEEIGKIVDKYRPQGVLKVSPGDFI